MVKESTLPWVSLALGLVTFALALKDVHWHLRRYLLPSIQQRMMALLFCSGAFAVFNGLLALLPRSWSYLSDLMTVSRCFWVLNYVQLLLGYFHIRGWGGRTENIHFAGAVLESADIPPQANAPWYLIPCAGAVRFKPGRSWLFWAVFRIECFVYGAVLLSVIKSILDQNGKLLRYKGDGCSYRRPCTTTTFWVFSGVALAIVAFGVSGVLPIISLLNPLLLPARRQIVHLRFALFLFFVPFHAALQTIIVGAVLAATVGEHTAIVALAFATSIEMCIFQVASHFAYIPRDVPGLPDRPTAEDIERTLEMLEVTVDVGDMASKFVRPSGCFN
ncbi:hypothetical protein M885DRAFT_558014 [Pelagophyceae sp. CCMP2097]|nr:hypothetical protein M885DRAFT_558014 [Pelagophyceae sp. CCMP2097]